MTVTRDRAELRATLDAELLEFRTKPFEKCSRRYIVILNDHSSSGFLQNSFTKFPANRMMINQNVIVILGRRQGGICVSNVEAAKIPVIGKQTYFVPAPGQQFVHAQHVIADGIGSS